MKNPYLQQYSIYEVKRRFLRFGIAITALLLATIALLVYFGEYCGIFTITVDELSQGAISICENKTFDHQTTRLQTDSKQNVWPVDFNAFDLEDISKTDGTYKAKNYIAYTFYLKNIGNTIIDVDCLVTLPKATKKLDCCSRIMIIQNNEIVGIYKKADDYIDEHDITPIELYRQYNDYNVCTLNLKSLQPGNIVKYTVVIWLEGWDIDCTDDKKGGAICYNMKFKIVNYYELD